MASTLDQDPSFNLTAYLEQPAPWENSAAAIRGIVISVTSVAVLCAVFRLYIRLAVLRVPGWDDMFVGLYLATTVTSAITAVISPSYGLGQHLITFTPAELRMFLLLFYIGNATYISSTAFMKLALLFQFLRATEGNDRGAGAGGDTAATTTNPTGSHRDRRFLRRACQVLIGIVALWGAAFSFLAWVPCFPVHQYWDMTPGGGTCYGFGQSTERGPFVAHTAINMALDVCVLAVPVALFLDRTSVAQPVPWRARAGTLALLLLGVVVNVFAAWRLVLLVATNSSALFTLFDSTFYAPDTVLLSLLEVNVASICASVPVFWPVLRQQVFRIVVTKEVEITRGKREQGDDDEEEEDDEEMAKQKPRTRSDAPAGDDGSGHSRPGSRGSKKNAAGHYDDTFIRDQVDPLRPGTSVGVETVVESSGKRSRWR